MKKYKKYKNHIENNHSEVLINENIFVLLLIIFIISSSYIVIFHIDNLIKDDIKNKLASAQSLVQIRLDAEYNLQKDAINRWAKNEHIVKFVETLNTLPLEPRVLIHSQAQLGLRSWLSPSFTTAGYRGYFIIDKNHINLASSRDANIGGVNLLASQGDILKGVWAGKTRISHPQPSDVPLSDFEGEVIPHLATMFVASPIRNAKGDVIAILAFRIEPDELFPRIFTAGQIAKTGETYAFNRKGVLLSESRFNVQLQSLGLISQSKHSDLAITIRDPSLHVKMGGKAPLPLAQRPLTFMARKATAEEPGFNLDGYNGYRGVPVVGMWSWNKQYAMGIATEINVEEAYATFSNTRFAIIIFTGFAVLVLIIHALRAAAFHKRICRETLKLDFLNSALDKHAIVSISNVRGNITYVNNKMCKVSGYSKKELIGHNHRILKSNEHHAEVFADLWKTILDGSVWQGELKNFKKNMNEYWVMSTIVPFINEQGEIFQYISICTDITERKQAELSALTANRAKSELMANMSHELRTPLNAIIGFTGTIQEEIHGPIHNEKYSDYINDIHDSGCHLLALINDILDVSAIEAGALKLDETTINLGDMVKAAARIIQPKATQGGVTLDLPTQAHFPSIFADGRRIKQIFLNVLSNAVKFTPPGGTVSMQLHDHDNSSISISIKDTGIGMTRKEIVTAMSTFGQVDSGLNRKHQGTGLGLPLTLGLIKLHDGILDVTSAPNKGTVITVTFPPYRVRR